VKPSLNYLTQSNKGQIGLSLWASDDAGKTMVTTTFWLFPKDAASIAKMLQREVEAQPRAVSASDLGLEAA